MEMPGRQFNSTTYTYSFNGKLDDKDAEYGWQDYGMREYDKRRSQFISVDPITKKYPELTPYQYASNTPIAAVDMDGLEGLAGPPIGSIYASNKGLYDDIIAGRNTPTVQDSRKTGAVIAVAGAIAMDAIVTKGWATRTLVASQVFGAFPHNAAATSEGREIQNQNSKDALANAFIFWGTGVILGKAINGASILYANAERLYNFGSKTLGEMGEEALSRQYGTIKPQGRGSSLGTSFGIRKPDGIPAGTTVNSTDKLFESKVGFQKFSGNIVGQVAKDEELLASGKVNQVTWVFYRSPNTGKIGAADDLLKALQNAGIKTQIAGDIPQDIINKSVNKYGASIKK